MGTQKLIDKLDRWAARKEANKQDAGLLREAVKTLLEQRRLIRMYQRVQNG
jgi:hypothetical protein